MGLGRIPAHTQDVYRHRCRRLTLACTLEHTTAELPVALPMAVICARPCMRPRVIFGTISEISTPMGLLGMRESTLGATGCTTRGVSLNISEGAQPWLPVQRLKVVLISLLFLFFSFFFSLTSYFFFCWQGLLWCRGKRLGSWESVAHLFPAALFADAVVAWLRASPPLEGGDPLWWGFTALVAVCYKVPHSTVGNHSSFLSPLRTSFC